MFAHLLDVHLGMDLLHHKVTLYQLQRSCSARSHMRAPLACNPTAMDGTALISLHFHQSYITVHLLPFDIYRVRWFRRINAPHPMVFGHLSTWFPVGGCLGRFMWFTFSLAKGSTSLGTGFEVKSLEPLPVCTLCFALVFEGVNSCHPAPAPAPAHARCWLPWLPDTMDSYPAENISAINSFFYKFP